uniref:Uncharacterized protein n=1 Tax=Opuntia streptacantha TaxID=393608 RepID=A0A7C8YGP4_OPUST
MAPWSPCTVVIENSKVAETVQVLKQQDPVEWFLNLIQLRELVLLRWARVNYWTRFLRIASMKVLLSRSSNMEAALNQHGTLPTSCVWKMEKLMSVILIFYQRKALQTSVNGYLLKVKGIMHLLYVLPIPRLLCHFKQQGRGEGLLWETMLGRLEIGLMCGLMTAGGKVW